MNSLEEISKQESGEGERTARRPQNVVLATVDDPIAADGAADSRHGILLETASQQSPGGASHESIIALAALKELKTLASGTPNAKHYALAKTTVGASLNERPEVGEVSALATLLAEHLCRFYEYVEMQGATSLLMTTSSNRSDSALEEEGGILRLDALGVKYLEMNFSGYGQDVATRVRAKSRARWSEYLAEPVSASRVPRVLELWYDPAHSPTPVRFTSLLASVIWRDVVQPRLEKAKQPALSLVVLEHTHAALWAPDRRVQHAGGGLIVVNGAGSVVARLRETETAPSLPEDIAASLMAMKTLSAHRLIRLLLEIGYIQDQIPGIREPSLIVVHGGFSGLARLLELEGRRSPQELQDILRVLQHAHILLPHGEIGGLLTYAFYTEAPGRSAELRIRLGDPLLPDYVVRLSKLTRSRRCARALVPVPALLPPFVGRQNEWAAQAALQMDVMIELRRNAGELARNHAVEISRNRWLSMARRTGLPERMVPAMIERWTNDGDDGPAFLVRPEPDRFTLSCHYPRELNMLIEAGKMEVEGQRRALRGASRASRLQR